MREGPHNYIPGGTLADCPVCGFTKRLDTLRLRWDGIWACPDDWDPRPDQLSAPTVGPEGLPRPNAQPMAPVRFVDIDEGPESL